MEEKELKTYELGFLLKTEANRQEVVKAIESAGFGIVNDGQISNVKLAYPINKQNFAQFGYVYFSGEPAKLAGLEGDLKMKSDVLRFMVFANPAIKQKEEVGQAERAYSAPEKRQRPEAPIKEVKQARAPKIETLSNEDLEKKLEEILK